MIEGAQPELISVTTKPNGDRKLTVQIGRHTATSTAKQSGGFGRFERAFNEAKRKATAKASRHG